jgi:hypothetical protein
MNQQFLFGTAYDYQNKDDIVYTPDEVARDIVEFFRPSGVCLDPCRGDGAFYKYLPLGSEWCELKDGKDFFEYTRKVDWIVSNPPYSVFAKFLDHSFTVAENIVYLIPVNKPFNSYAILQRVKEWGGIKHILVIAPGAKLNFPIGFAIGAVHFKRQYDGPIGLSFREL